MQLNKFVHFEEIFDFLDVIPVKYLFCNETITQITLQKIQAWKNKTNIKILDSTLAGSLPIECKTGYIEQYLIIYFPN